MSLASYQTAPPRKDRVPLRAAKPTLRCDELWLDEPGCSVDLLRAGYPDEIVVGRVEFRYVGGRFRRRI